MLKLPFSHRKCVILHPLFADIDIKWFRSSVGLEQQPSKLWVLGSNPNGITKHQKEDTKF